MFAFQRFAIALTFSSTATLFGNVQERSLLTLDDPMVRAEVAWLQPYAEMGFGEGASPLNEIPLRRGGSTFTEFGDADVRVRIEAQPFDHPAWVKKKAHGFHLENDPIIGWSGIPHGDDPHLRMSRVELVWDGAVVPIPEAAFVDLFNPLFCKPGPNGALRFATVARSTDGWRIYVSIQVGEGVAAHLVTWVFKDGVYRYRIVDRFLTDERVIAQKHGSLHTGKTFFAQLRPMRRNIIIGTTIALAQVVAAQVPINGPMPGYSECLESIIWLQCHGPCKAQLAYWKTGRPDSLLYTAEQTSEASKAHAMDFIMDQVVPGTTYEYRVLIDKKPVVFRDTLRFRTQGLWKFRSDPPDFTIATGSCTYVNERAYDRPDGPNGPYGGDYGIFNSIADKRPDLMLWLGDNVYLREPDWGSWSGILHRYTHTRSLPELQRLLHSTHHYATWDDHDFGPNDGDGSFIQSDLTRKAFDLFWPNPASMAPGVGGIATSFTYADVDFFLLDDRSFRVPPDVVTDSATLLGKPQIDWLIRALKYSDASFKIVALGGQFLNTAAVYENYATFPEERQLIIDRLEREQVKNVVFLTGDRHFTELSKLQLANGETIHDLTVSPLTSSAYSPKETNTLNVPGTVLAERNFALLRVSGTKGHRSLTVSVHDKDGKERWQQMFEQSTK